MGSQSVYSPSKPASKMVGPLAPGTIQRCSALLGGAEKPADRITGPLHAVAAQYTLAAATEYACKIRAALAAELPLPLLI
jgi:hypothetical protein